MKKFLLIIIGIIVFALVAFSGAINAFYDTTVSSTIPVVHAEELEAIAEDTCAEGHLLGVYEEEEFRVEAVDFMNPTDAYEFNDAFKYFLEEGDLRWNGGNTPNCQDDAFAIFDCKDCGKLIVIDLKGDHTPGEEVFESDDGNYKVCTVCGEHIKVLDAEEPEEILEPEINLEEPAETPDEEVIEEPVEEPAEEEPIEEPSEEIIDEPTEEEPVVEEPEEVVDPEAEEPTEEVEEPVEDEEVISEEPTETEEPTEAEETVDEEPATEETELLGDKLLTLVGLKDIVDEIGLDVAKKIGLGVVAIGSFLEAIIVLNIFKKKQDRAPKAMKGPRPPRPRRHRKHTREIPIEGYREPPRREGIKF